MHVSQTQTRKARKDHRCWWCGGPIPKGSLYDCWTSFDDVVATVKVHPECRKAWHSLPYYDAESLAFAEYCRGCTCEHGRCECGQAANAGGKLIGATP